MKRSLGFLVFLALAPVASAASLPAGWIKHASHPVDYEVGVDINVLHEGRPTGFIRAASAEPRGFGTLMQWAPDPGRLRGHQVKLSAWVRAEKIDGENAWAGLWFRVDGRWSTPDRDMLAFDNMHDRPIKGTTDWTRVEIVLDVPEEAQAIAFGVLLQGGGQVWLDHLKFELIGPVVPVDFEN